MKFKSTYITIPSVILAFTAVGYSLLSSKTSEPAPVSQARMINLGVPSIMKITSKDDAKVILKDSSIRKNWGIMNTQANKAWDITLGSHDIIVAVIDTGIDVNHPDLKSNIWVNAGESGLDGNGHDKSHNGIDDDHNGFIDDANGWDFVNESPVLKDNHGHGTHIAGIVGANGGPSGDGLFGVAPKVKIMALKYFDPQSRGGDNLKNTIRAIHYAIKNGARIINYSGGGLEPNDDEFKAIKEARDKGILFVAAAGNERSNSDLNHYYPANYSLDNIISVTAVNTETQILKTSNFGASSVNIAAPGEDIKSTLPESKHGKMTGTSQATAFVTGVAALVMANNKDFNYAQVKNQITKTADEYASLRNKTSNSGKLNSYNALAMQPDIPATGIPSVAASPRTTGVITDSISPAESNLQTVLKALNQPYRQAASFDN